MLHSGRSPLLSSSHTRTLKNNPRAQNRPIMHRTSSGAEDGVSEPQQLLLLLLPPLPASFYVNPTRTRLHFYHPIPVFLPSFPIEPSNYSPPPTLSPQPRTEQNRTPKKKKRLIRTSAVASPSCISACLLAHSHSFTRNGPPPIFPTSSCAAQRNAFILSFFHLSCPAQPSPVQTQRYIYNFSNIPRGNSAV